MTALRFAFLTVFSLLSLAHAAPHPAVVSGTSFFQDVLNGEIDSAYAKMSDAFRSKHSQEAFTTYLKESGADELTSFEVRKATGSEDGLSVRIVARVESKKGKPKNSWVVLEKGESGYGVSCFDVYPVGTSLPPPVSDPEAAQKICISTLQSIAKGIEDDDLSPYLSTVPIMDRMIYGEDAIRGAVLQLDSTKYGPISGMAERISGLHRPSTMTDIRATYAIAVDYPEKKRRLIVEFVSLWSDPRSNPWLNRWEFAYLNPESPTEVPEADVCQSLASETLTGLFASLKSGALEDFYADTTPFFKEVVALERFQNAYPAFTGGSVDPSTWDVENFQILDTAMKGKIGPSLDLEVLIPTPDGNAYVTLTYLHEEDTWRNSGVVFYDDPPGER